MSLFKRVQSCCHISRDLIGLQIPNHYMLMSSNGGVYHFSSTSFVKNRKSEISNDDILLLRVENGIATLTMNQPKKLNGWTQDMMLALKHKLKLLSHNPNVKVTILTGTDPYYCAGVNLSSTIHIMHPRRLHQLIADNNEELFNCFLNFTKPLLIAANGPAIGACVTSATLCDAIIASDRATFHTPFAALCIPAEGCSSVHFEKLMGSKNADKMLKHGWKPTAKEALEAGLITHVVPHEHLMVEANRIATNWIQEGKVRELRAGANLQEYLKVNAKESKELASAFLDTPFLQAQAEFLSSKKKHQLSMIFRILKFTRPLWSKLL